MIFSMQYVQAEMLLTLINFCQLTFNIRAVAQLQIVTVLRPLGGRRFQPSQWKNEMLYEMKKIEMLYEMKIAKWREAPEKNGY